MPRTITEGCWVDTPWWGKAVVTKVTPNCIFVRYPAIRPNGKLIWVANGVPPQESKFLRGPDEESLHVLTLEGPYGE